MSETKKNKRNGMEIMLANGRVSFPHVFTPQAYDDNEAPMYSVTLLFDKETDAKQIKELQSKIDSLAKLAGTPDGEWGRAIKDWHNPLQDGDEEVWDSTGEPKFPGYYFVTVRSGESYPPIVVNAQRNPILDVTEVYGGCYANVIAWFTPYASGKNKGITARLNGFQKTKDGEPFGAGPKRAEDMFEIVDEDDDDDDLLG